MGRAHEGPPFPEELQAPNGGGGPHFSGGTDTAQVNNPLPMLIQAALIKCSEAHT